MRLASLATNQRDQYIQRFKMAEVLTELVTRLRAYRDSLSDLVVEVLEENKTFIEDAVIMQLQRGERGDGLILPNYSPVSVYAYGKPPGPIKLFDTGAFYRGITARVNPKAVEMVSTDSKTEKIFDRFGEEVIEVQEGNWEVIQSEILLPQLLIKSERYLLNR